MKKINYKIPRTGTPLKGADAMRETVELMNNPTARKTLRAAKRGKLTYKKLNLADSNFGL